MSKKTKPKVDLDRVVLVTPARGTASGGSTPGIEPHSRTVEKALTRSLQDLKQEWSVVNQQVIVLLEDTDKSTTKSGFALDEVSFALGISAKGHIGFLAGVEAGGEASITLKFTRRK